jgi:membrane associated rhomboid family serine protease
MPVENLLPCSYCHPEMLEDRYYMRRPSFGPHRSATVALVVTIVLAFIVQKVLESSASSFRINDYLALSLGGLKRGYVWQLLSFQFLHSGFLHLLGNCLVIFFLGRPVEEALGRRSFLLLYFSSGVVGGLCQTLAGIFATAVGWHPLYFTAPVVGASAGGFGITAAFALLFPDQILLLFMIIPMRAKYLLWLCAGLAGWGVVFPDRSLFGQHVADVAHLGGILAGFIFVKYAVHWHFQWPQLNRRAHPPVRRLVKVHSQKPGWGRDKPVIEEELPPEEFLSKEVDPILDKISAQGIQSLTDRERRILEAARTKMGKR